MIHKFNADGFDSLHRRYAGGRPPKFNADQRQRIKEIALARPTDHGLRFSTWSLAKLSDFLVTDALWGSTPMIIRPICCSSPFGTTGCRREGQCYFQLGNPLT